MLFLWSASQKGLWFLIHVSRLMAIRVVYLWETYEAEKVDKP